MKECDNDNGGKHQADHGGINDADNLDSFAIFIIIETQSLEHSREAVTHMEPDNNEENQIGDGDIWDLKHRAGLMVKVQIAVNPSKFNEEEMREMQQEAGDDEDACPDLQLRACMRLGTLGFMVAFWACPLVGDG